MLKDRITFVTGASAGIGAACAEAFAREGSHLLLAARRGARLAAEAERLVVDHGVRCHVIELDVRDRAAVEAAVADLPPAWRDVDILVNNAGLSRGLEPVHEGDATDWEEMIDTNIKGLLWVTRAVLPGMVARDRGHVINIGSVSGRQVYAGGGVYCGTKFAVRALTQGLRLDLLGTKVRCSTVDPGMVQTEFSEVRFHGDAARADQVYRNFPPLQAMDVAETVLFCATRPPHVNVQEILVMPQDQAAVHASHPRGVE
jgi:NADP-dependent 3-hydroxy acid dehydrogenase YdfG